MVRSDSRRWREDLLRRSSSRFRPARRKASRSWKLRAERRKHGATLRTTPYSQKLNVAWELGTKLFLSIQYPLSQKREEEEEEEEEEEGDDDDDDDDDVFGLFADV